MIASFDGTKLIKKLLFKMFLKLYFCRKHTRKLTRALHEAALRQVAALQDLEGVLQREKREAVDAAHQQEQQIATEKL